MATNTRITALATQRHGCRTGTVFRSAGSSVWTAPPGTLEPGGSVTAGPPGRRSAPLAGGAVDHRAGDCARRDAPLLQDLAVDAVADEEVDGGLHRGGHAVS